MSAIETKRLKAQIRELETQNRKYLSDCICMQHLVEVCRERHPPGVETGRFGAHMVVSLVNDGPVTFLLRP